MIKVAIDSGATKSGHAVRGIGVMVKDQIGAMLKYCRSEVNLDAFNFDEVEGKLKLENGNYDIVHYPYFFPYALTLPKVNHSAKIVVTIQDLIHLIYPKQYPPGVRGMINFIKQKSRLKSADSVITVSETSKKDIVRFLGIPSEKVHTIYLAPSLIYKVTSNEKSLRRVAKKYKLPEKFVFNLGDVNYNKNIPTLIDACELIGIPLVLGGKQARDIDDGGLLNLMDLSGPNDYLRFLLNKPHPEHAHYARMLEKFKDKDKVIRLGYIPDDDVSEVMNLATVYCQPSYYEGFGLSVVHAFACDTPVVISRTNCLVEIAGGAALIANPNSAEDFAEKIKEVMKNSKTRRLLVTKGKDRLKDFSWEKSAKEMVNVYQTVLSVK